MGTRMLSTRLLVTMAHTGAKAGAVNKGTILQHDLDNNRGRVHGVLFRNKKDGRAVFQMLVRRGYDASLRVDGKTITIRILLLELTEKLKAEGITTL